MLSKSREKMNMEMWFVLALWFQLLTLSFEQQPKYQEVQQKVYVSRGRGRDFPSCGSPSNPCKTIVMGAWKVQHNGQVFVDGTGSEEHPYPCKSSSLESSGIHSNKSMVITGVQEIPHVKCQEGYDIRLAQSLLDHNMTTVQLTNLKFVNTSVNAQDINLYIDNCVFTGASRAVNLVQSTTAIEMSFKSSVCVHVSCCIATNITKSISTGNNVSIIVTDSTMETSWYDSSAKLFPINFHASGITVVSLGQYGYKPGSISCHIAVKNVSFNQNVLGTHGIIYLSLENGFTSLRLDDVVFLENKPLNYGSVRNIISVDKSYKHETILNNVNFLQNFEDCCRVLQVNTKRQNTLQIANSQFHNFKMERSGRGGLLDLYSNDNSEIYVKNTTFTNISMSSNGGCLYLSSRTSKIMIKDSTFRNTISLCGGVMWLSVKDVLVATIQGCHFQSSIAGGPAGLAGFESKDVNVEIINSTVKESKSNSGSGGMINIGFAACGYAIQVEAVSLSFRNVQIIGSQAVEGSGGVAAVQAQKGSIIVEDSTIKDSRSYGSGGTFYTYFVSLLGLLSSEIGYDIRFSNSTFKNSISTVSGGLLYCNAANQLNFENVTMDTVTVIGAGESGAGLYIFSSNVTVNIENSVIKNFYSTYHPAVYLSTVSTLKISNSVFESNAATDTGCLHLSTSVSDVILRNVTFKHCYGGGSKGGAIFFTGGGGKTTIESCQFCGNEGAIGIAGAIAFDLPNNDRVVDSGCINSVDQPKHANPQMLLSHRVWTYSTYVTITNTTFTNNVAINGGALFLSRGSYIIQNCTFVDNFAKLRGGHIFVTSESTSLQIMNSQFLQKHPTSPKIKSIYEQDVTYSIGTFIDSQSTGPLIILDSKLESRPPSQGESKILVSVSNANYVSFGNDNKTKLICPRGYSINIINFTTQIDRNGENGTKPCLIALNALQYICKPCGIGTYSLQKGTSLGRKYVSNFKCLPCPFGAECLHKITAKPNFWGYEVQKHSPELSFILCPVGYCGHSKELDKDSNFDYNSCDGNRTGTLCGKCRNDFVETLFSPSCRRKDECKDTWLIGVAVVMVMLMGVFLVHKQRLLPMLKSHILWFRGNTRQEDEDASKNNKGGGYLKIVFYFYQVANILLITTTYDGVLENYLLQPVVGIFSFQIRFKSSGLLCPFVGLTVVTKQLLLLCPVFGVLLMIAVCYGCRCLLHKCTSKPTPTLGPCLGAALETLLLGYAVFANTALKLLRCTSFGGEKRLFIAGNKLCYQWWQYLLVVFVLGSVFPFILTLALGSRWLYKGQISTKEFLIGCIAPLPYLVYKMISSFCRPQEQRPECTEWKAPVVDVLYGPFRSPHGDTAGALYWESILIFRRLVLIMIYVFVPDPLSKELLLTVTCVFILFHHTIVRPFHSQAANVTEMISLFGLVIIATINTYNASFLSFGQTKQGPLLSLAAVLNQIQTIILTAAPLLCCLAVVAVIISQLIRLAVKIWSSAVKYSDWHVSDDQVRRLLAESSNCED